MNDILGSGWSFPVRFDYQRGQVALARREADIEQAIWMILLTPKGQRVMRPEFGCQIHELVFAPNDATTAGLAAYYVEKKEVPASLEAAGVAATLADGSQLSLDSETMTLTVDTPQGQLVFTPDENADGSVTWHCAGGVGVRTTQLPTGCQSER